MGILLLGRVFGETQINLGNNDSPGAFINFMKGFVSQSFPTGTDPSNLDANGYPKTTLAGNIGGNVSLPSGFAGNGVNWVIKNTGTRNLKVSINRPVTKSAQSGSVATSGGSNSTMDVTFTGIGSVTFAFNNYVASSLSFYYPSGFANTTGTGELVLVRAGADEAAYDAGTYFTPEFVAMVRDLRPKTIRPMGWVQTGAGNACNQVQWRYRTTPSSLSWSTTQFPPGAWGGTVSGTDTYSISAATDTPGSYTDGEVIQGKVTNAPTRITISGAAAAPGTGVVRLTVNSTATLTTGQVVWIDGVEGTTEANGFPTVTVVDATHIDLQGVPFVHAYLTSNFNAVGTQKINIGARGDKWLANLEGVPLFKAGSGDAPIAGSLATFVYDGVLDKVLWSNGGINSSVPIEAQVQLANTISANLWSVIPPMADNTYVSTWAAYIRDNLIAPLTLYAEYTNENWNFVFPQAQWSNQRGLAFGFVPSADRALHGWYALRFRQVMGAITALWGSRGGLKRVMAFQAYGNTSDNNNYRFKGTDLVTGNAAYNTYTGSISYNSAPNRPIDYADVLSYATYYQGASFNDGFSYSLSRQAAANIAILQSMADNYNTGTTASIAAAQALMDTDFRTGTNANDTTPQNMADLNANIYPAWETIAASYTGKTVEPYEGALQAVAPTAAQCTTLGISVGGSAATASTALDGLLTSYKNNATYAVPLVVDQFNQFMTFSHSRQPSWLNITGPSAWSLYPGDLFTTAYQLANGFRAYR